MIKIIAHYGGKERIAKELLPLLNAPHDRFVTPFAGFMSLELRKPRAQTEIAGDINTGTVDLLRTLRDNPDPLIQQLNSLTWNEALFQQCRGQRTAIEAIAFAAMSYLRGGSVSGFSQAQCDRNIGRDWAYLKKTSDRLQRYKIFEGDWRVTLDAIGKGNEDTLVYLDPPYLSGGENYLYTMSQEEHEKLLSWCIRTRCRVAISGYDSGLYYEYLHSWNRFVIPSRNSRKAERIECLWTNYEP